MKKQFPTFIHETASGFDRVFVSAGKVGFQIELRRLDVAACCGLVAVPVRGYCV